MGMYKRRRKTIQCAECRKMYTYITAANPLKVYCPDCSKVRISASKKRSKEHLAENPRRLEDAEELALLDKIPDRPISWNRYIDQQARIAT